MIRKPKAWLSKTQSARGASSSGTVYSMGLFGAVYYFWIHSVGFGATCLGIIKAVLWPAFVVYYGLEFLKVL